MDGECDEKRHGHDSDSDDEEQEDEEHERDGEQGAHSKQSSVTTFSNTLLLTSMI